MSTERFTWLIIAVIGVFCTLPFMCGVVCAEVAVDMDALAMVESSGDPDAVSFLGAKYGRGLY